MPSLVDEAIFAPHMCSLTGSSEGPLFDTGTNMPTMEGRVYVGKRGMETLAQAFGYPTLSEWQRTKDELEVISSEVELLRNENQELSRSVDAIDLLESHGFSARKKTGRPKKVEE
jgi:hypothetical protein